jgi:hypothetical protein
LFTVGAVIFAALENEDELKKSEILKMWNYLESKYSPKITDHRKKCLDKHLPKH